MLLHRLYGILRTGRMETTVSIGMVRLEPAVIGGQRPLIELERRERGPVDDRHVD